jgi:hypothetical protein
MPNLANLIGLSLALGFASSGPEPMSDADLSTAVALIIQQNGFPCAEVLDVRPHDEAQRYEVTCTERQGETAVARYIMDLRDGTAVKG